LHPSSIHTIIPFYIINTHPWIRNMVKLLVCHTFMAVWMVKFFLVAHEQLRKWHLWQVTDMASDAFCIPTYVGKFECKITSQFCCSPLKQENNMNNNMEKWVVFVSDWKSRKLSLMLLTMLCWIEVLWEALWVDSYLPGWFLACIISTPCLAMFLVLKPIQVSLIYQWVFL